MTSQNTAIWKHIAHNISTKLTRHIFFDLFQVSSILWTEISLLYRHCHLFAWSTFSTCFVCITFFFLWYITFCHWVKYFKLYHNVIVSPKYSVPNVVYVCMRGSRIFFLPKRVQRNDLVAGGGVYIQFLWPTFNLQRTVFRCIMSCQ